MIRWASFLEDSLKDKREGTGEDREDIQVLTFMEERKMRRRSLRLLCRFNKVLARLVESPRTKITIKTLPYLAEMDYINTQIMFSHLRGT